MKHFAILFYDEHLAYSPTLLNLINILRENNKVSIIAPPPVGFTKLEDPDVNYVDMDWRLARTASIYRLKMFGKRLGLSTSPDTHLEPATYVKVHSLRNALKSISFDGCIAVDPTALWIAQSVGVQPHFLSLELFERPLSKYVNYQSIQSFCIQSQERMDAGPFANVSCPVFFLPNSTVFKEVPATTRSTNQLLFCGTATQGFGIYTCLHFLQDNSKFQMTVQGTLPDDVWTDILKFWPNLIETRQLIINRKYIEESEMNAFLVHFRIGFCIYDTRVKYINNINYQTAPSGKLWKYLAAGIPVIGSDIQGLSIVKERNCGVLISQLTSDAVSAAIESIESDYVGYQNRALETAKEYSFDIHAAPYIKHLIQ